MTKPTTAVAVVATTALLVAASTGISVAAPAGSCQPPFSSGNTYKCPVSQLRATQFVLGYLEIACEIGHIEGLDASGKLDSYLDGKHVPGYAAPDGFIYIVDHHHLCRSIHDANIKDSHKMPYVDVQGDFSDLSDMNAFWEKMIATQNVWLYGSTGEHAQSPVLLPTDFARLENDPYRSLAWLVRSNGGYEKLSVPFQDFMYGNLFRENNLVPFPQQQDIDGAGRVGGSYPSWTLCSSDPYNPTCFNSAGQNQSAVVNAAVPAAMKLARSSAASGLPGYGGGSVKPPTCS